MDYEKKYKEALGWMQGVYPTLTGAAREDAEYFFPELAESEDERIRKSIIHILQVGGYMSPEEKDKAFAYLEKQKEPHYTKRNVLFDKCVENCDPEIMKEVSNEIDSQLKKEQKLVEPSDEELQRHQDELHDFKMFAARQAKEHHISFVHDFEWNNFCVELLSYFNEQKPAEWSEEDENKLYQVVETLLADKTITLRENPHCKALHRAYDELIDWLKSLPKRFNLQPKQEWSEEDENNLELVIDCIYKFYPDPVMKYKLKEWLKSLRPSKDCSSCAKNLEGYISGRIDAENKLLEQFGALITPEDELHIKPRWKPSEEQMQYLLAVINDPNNAGAESCHLILESLYNDLKEL